MIVESVIDAHQSGSLNLTATVRDGEPTEGGDSSSERDKGCGHESGIGSTCSLPHVGDFARRDTDLSLVHEGEEKVIVDAKAV